METQRQRKNIYIIGPQSTGKTTLVNALANRYTRPNSNAELTRPAIIQEVARKVLKAHSYSRDGIINSQERALELQKLILQAQSRAEEEALGGSIDAWFISDRSGLDPLVYANIFVGQDALQSLMSLHEWETLERRLRNGLVVLCEAGGKWLVDDGTRLMPKNVEDWLVVDSGFKAMVAHLEIDAIVIPKDMENIESRLQIIFDALA